MSKFFNVNSQTEENYLKTIYKLSRQNGKGVNTTALAKELNTKASSVTDMIRKLAEKGLIHYKKYQGVKLTNKGKHIAVHIIRKHRLWEVFMVEKLGFKWDEVHEMAEQLEHIKSSELIDRLDNFLNHPRHDPHGDPIPDRDGNIEHHKNTFLSDIQVGESAIILGVKEHSSSFLQYLEKNEMMLGTKVKVVNVFEFDNSLNILSNGNERTISNQVSRNLYVKKIN